MIALVIEEHGYREISRENKHEEIRMNLGEEEYNISTKYETRLFVECRTNV